MNYLQKNYYHLFPALSIFLLSVAIYANAVNNGFVYDDNVIIVKNPELRSISNIPSLFTKDYFNISKEASYRPIVTLSYFFDYAAYGPNPSGFHITNILIHAVNGILLYMFLNLLLQYDSQRQGVAFFISLLFISHPVATEAVNGISFREDLLSFFFYTATLVLYIISKRHHPSTNLILFTGSCMTYILALLSKEMAVTLPLTICLYELFHAKKTGSVLRNPRSMAYMIITCIYLYMRFFYFYNPMEDGFPAWGLSERLFTVPSLIIYYIKLCLFPVTLSVDYDIAPIRYLFSCLIILSLMLIYLLSLLQKSFCGSTGSPRTGGKQMTSIRPPFALSLSKGKFAPLQKPQDKKKDFAFGTLLFLISLIPVFNIVPIMNPFAERYLYLPLLGFSIASGSIIYTVTASKKKLVTALFFCAIFGIYAASVINRNNAWRDDYSLWSDAVKKVRTSRSYYSLGIAHDKQGRVDDAISLYATAVQMKPDYLSAHLNLGYIYLRTWRLKEAEDEFKICIRIRPDNFKARNNLGTVYYLQGRLDEAIEEYKLAFRLNPNDPALNYNLGLALKKKGQLRGNPQ